MSKKVHSKASFQEKWLDNIKYKTWLAQAPSDKNTARCILCKKDINISTMGVSALESHAAGKRHTDLLNERKNYKDVFFIPTQSSNANKTTSQKSVDSSSSCTISTRKSINGFMASRNSIDAEILWCMNVVISHHSFNSCSDLKNIFTKMFPDSDIATQFTLGKTKRRYMILYGLAPYYKDKLIKQINDSICYIISFDEALSSIVQKCQMDVSVRCWDDKVQMVKTRYFDSQFLERPNADNQLESIKLNTESLRNESLLQLAMDGPNVNWEVLTKLNGKLVEDRSTKTLNIGSWVLRMLLFMVLFKTDR